MKKLLVIALVVMLALGLSTATGFALTEIWSKVVNTGGTTHFYEFATIGGWDSSYDSFTGAFTVTAYVDERIDNVGSIVINKYIKSPGDWEMLEVKNVSATGSTQIYKDAVFWTEDSRTTFWTDPELLMFPTEAAVVWDYQNLDNPTLSDDDYVTYLLDIPPAMDPYPSGHYAQFETNLLTDDDLYFQEKVGINIYLGKGIPVIPAYDPPDDC